MVDLGECTELGLLWQYRSLRQQLEREDQPPSCGELTEQIFQVVCLLVNSFTARIEAIQLHMSDLRVHLLHHEDASLIDSKYPTFTLLDVKAVNSLAQYFPPEKEEVANPKQIVKKERTGSVFNLDEEDITEVFPWQSQVIQEDVKDLHPRDPLMTQLKERQKKQLHKKKQRIDLQLVRDFIRQVLAPQLEYNPDHSTHNIPKKVIMQLYQQWCKKINKNPQVEDSLVQMSLTNALKSAFPAIDTYTRQYRGLRFVKGFLKSEFNTSL